MQLRAFDPSEPALPEPSPSREEGVAALLTALPVEIAERILAKLGATRGGRLRARMGAIAESPPPPGALEELMGELRQRMSSKPAPAPRLVESVEAKPAPAPRPCRDGEPLPRRLSPRKSLSQRPITGRDRADE